MSTNTGKKSYPQSIHLEESRGCNLLAVCYNTRMNILALVIFLLALAIMLWGIE